MHSALFLKTESQDGFNIRFVSADVIMELWKISGNSVFLLYTADFLQIKFLLVQSSCKHILYGLSLAPIFLHRLNQIIFFKVSMMARLTLFKDFNLHFKCVFM